MLCWLCATLSDEDKQSLIYCPMCAKTNEDLMSEKSPFSGQGFLTLPKLRRKSKPFLTAADLIMLREMKISL